MCWFLFFVLLSSHLLCNPHPVLLRPREPHFRPEIVQSDWMGNSLHVLYFAPKSGGVQGEEIAVKEILFYPSGEVSQERDLGQDSKGNSVAHGASVSYYKGGAVKEKAFFVEGKWEAERQTFYANGSREGIYHYAQGMSTGEYEFFYPSGKKREVRSKTACTCYYEGGERACYTPYLNGLPHGQSIEWYDISEGGGKKRLLSYQQGLLYGDGQTAALLVYSPQGAVIESCDFILGKAQGPHVRYTPEGKLLYRIHYEMGKKEGKEEFFSEEGHSLGGGLYRGGKAFGLHRHLYASGKVKYLAPYHEHSAGKLVGEVQEYDEEGHLLTTYGLMDEQKAGPIRTYYPNGCGQIKSAYFLADGQKDGMSRRYYENGQMAEEMCYKRGLIEGWARQWHENGQLKSEVGYRNGKLHGNQMLYNAEGAVISSAHWINDRPEGLMKGSNKKGEPIFFGNYVGGLQEGLFYWAYDNGQPKRKTHFSGGKRHGIEERYWENGNLMSRAHFVQDSLEGSFQSFYASGCPYQDFAYCRGMPVGEHCEYYDISESEDSRQNPPPLARRLSFREGKFHGQCEAYHENGRIAGVLTYDRGILHGKKVKYDPEGGIIEEGNYERGLLDGRYVQVNADGEQIITHYRLGKKEGWHQIMYPPEREDLTAGKQRKVKRLEAFFKEDLLEGDVVDYAKNGMKVATTPYKKGQLEGQGALFSEDGRLIMTVNYRDNCRQGDAVSYYPSGYILQKTVFQNDRRHGQEIHYFENGQIAAEYDYRNDLKEGVAREFNEKGVLLFEGHYNQGKLHGQMKKFYDDGAIKLIANYANDQLIDKQIFQIADR